MHYQRTRALSKDACTISVQQRGYAQRSRRTTHHHRPHHNCCSFEPDRLRTHARIALVNNAAAVLRCTARCGRRRRHQSTATAHAWPSTVAVLPMHACNRKDRAAANTAVVHTCTCDEQAVVEVTSVNFCSFKQQACKSHCRLSTEHCMQSVLGYDGTCATKSHTHRWLGTLPRPLLERSPHSRRRPTA